jgi:hypothetical protein
MLIVVVGRNITPDFASYNREESELKRVVSHSTEEGERDEEGVEAGDCDSRKHNHFFIYSKYIC